MRSKIKKLMVVPWATLEKVQDFYKDRSNLKIVTWGDALLGNRFDEIYVIWPCQTEVNVKEVLRNSEWLETSVRTKLKRKGKFLELNLKG